MKEHQNASWHIWKKKSCVDPIFFFCFWSDRHQKYFLRWVAKYFFDLLKTNILFLRALKKVYLKVSSCPLYFLIHFCVFLSAEQRKEYLKKIQHKSFTSSNYSFGVGLFWQNNLPSSIQKKSQESKGRAWIAYVLRASTGEWTNEPEKNYLERKWTKIGGFESFFSNCFGNFPFLSRVKQFAFYRQIIFGEKFISVSFWQGGLKFSSNCHSSVREE